MDIWGHQRPLRFSLQIIQCHHGLLVRLKARRGFHAQVSCHAFRLRTSVSQIRSPYLHLLWKKESWMCSLNTVEIMSNLRCSLMTWYCWITIIGSMFKLMRHTGTSLCNVLWHNHVFSAWCSALSLRQMWLDSFRMRKGLTLHILCYFLVIDCNFVNI